MAAILSRPQWVNTLRPRQNGRHFSDDIFKWIFLNENVWILINISLKCVPMSPINNIPTLVQVLAWRWPGDKPLSEPMMVRLPTHVCVTRRQWVNIWRLSLSLCSIPCIYLMLDASLDNFYSYNVTSILIYDLIFYYVSSYIYLMLDASLDTFYSYIPFRLLVDIDWPADHINLWFPVICVTYGSYNATKCFHFLHRANIYVCRVNVFPMTFLGTNHTTYVKCMDIHVDNVISCVVYVTWQIIRTVLFIVMMLNFKI